MLGALATQIVMMATGSREPIEDYHHGNQASAYSLAPDPVNQLSTQRRQKQRLKLLKRLVGSAPNRSQQDLNLTDAYNNLWQKAWMSFDWAERWLNLDQFDFVLKADDDTFVVVENLRLLLAPLDPGQPVHLGRWFFYDRDPKQSYMSGGGGYVLSRAAVRLFLARAVRSASTPKSTCLSSLGVKFVDSRDVGGLDRFHPINVEYMIGWGPAEMPPWMWKINYYKFRACLEKCVSSVAATFHYTDNLYLMEFLLYGASGHSALIQPRRNCRLN
uniref:N-acetylgalactosaminide beta-1,3-galactosyltransferase n=1 Tax=Macrostomum lignano TaxID=282301 RepID=A0A1I8IZ63_9PLAT